MIIKLTKSLKPKLFLLFTVVCLSCTKDNNGWDKTTETSFKINCKKAMLTYSSMTNEQATFVTDCMVEKIKENKLSPTDAEKEENDELILRIGQECSENWNKFHSTK